LFLGIPLIWYRDNCPCPQCRDPKSGQKLFQITELSEGLALKSVEETADTITVSFAPDDHRSVFSREWLSAKADAGRGDWRSEAGKKLWLASEIGDRLPVTSWNLYKSNDAERLRLLREIDALGFAIVRKAPRDEGTVLEIAKTFGYVRETNYGALFDVRVELTPSNLAFTGLAIGPHTDNPYRDPVPTMQLLHCLSNAVDGGESGLVDGFKAAALLAGRGSGCLRGPHGDARSLCVVRCPGGAAGGTAPHRDRLRRVRSRDSFQQQVDAGPPSPR
jgi:gamma-butyrobetaine dioxygenase